MDIRLKGDRKVVKATGPRSYSVQSEQRVYRRNRRHLVHLPEESSEEDDSIPEPSEQQNPEQPEPSNEPSSQDRSPEQPGELPDTGQQHNTPVLRRSGRQVKQRTFFEPAW